MCPLTRARPLQNLAEVVRLDGEEIDLLLGHLVHLRRVTVLVHHDVHVELADVQKEVVQIDEERIAPYKFCRTF